MNVKKDPKTGKWEAQFYFTDWKGKSTKKHKRGFATKKEAIAWVNEFLMTNEVNLSMTLEQFVEVYFRDKDKELSERSKYNKRKMMEKHIIPYLGKKRMNEITPSDIIQWQMVILNLRLSPSYQRSLQNQISALFTFATNVYDLKKNPVKKVSKIGANEAEEKDFWTEDEFEAFLESIDPNSHYYILYQLLFWTGIREGEALALTIEDFDFEKNQLRINKSFYRRDKTDFVKEPKTKASNRVIEVPVFLMNQIKEFTDRLYGLKKDDRIFPISARAVQTAFARHIEKAGAKVLTVHELRHSHTTWLAFNGIDPNVAKRRLGHSNIRTTLDTYTHVTKSQNREVADLIDKKKMNPDDGNHQGSGE